MKLCYLDAEFNGVSEASLNLVSIAALCTVDGKEVYQRDYWLHRNPRGKAEARKFFQKIIDEGFIFVAYVMEAEARTLLSLFGEDKSWVEKIKAIDLYLEYRNLLNHNNALAYGEQYIDGEVITTSPPVSKYKKDEGKKVVSGFTEFKFDNEDEDEEDAKHHKPHFSLASAVFKLNGVKIDTEEKTRMRDIIIAGDPDIIDANREAIQKYNASDIVHLPKLLRNVHKIHRDKGETLDGFITAALKRGDYAVRTARMIELGYPVNLDKVNAFTFNVKGILNEAIEDCLEYSSEVESFRFDKKEQKYKAAQKNLKAWIEAQKRPYWRKTKGGQISLSKDAFNDWFNSDSAGFAGAFCRYLKTKQSLNGFVPSKTSKKGAFKDFIGSDDRVRPYFGIYGSQSSRSQPGATAYLWLKSKWMQNFLQAKPGKALAACDFASQEFLVAGIISQDDNMIDSYASGDVYLAFGKLAGMIPEGGTKETHRKEREICKTIILGMSYGMTSMGLAPRLSQAMKTTYTPDEVQKYVDLFEEAYPTYRKWKWDTLRSYEDNGFLQLSDGWVMWGDNDNSRSVTNFMVQGEGAVILRESVRLCQQAGLDVIATVHDSIVIECESKSAPNWTATLQMAMQQGFENVMSKYGRTVPIRTEGECWSVDFGCKQVIDNVTYTEEFIHEKAVADYERYKKYLVPPTPEQIAAYEEKMSSEVAKIAEEKVKKPRKARLPKAVKTASGASEHASV